MRPRIWALVGVDLAARLAYGLARTPALPLYAAFLGAGPTTIGLVGAASTLTGVALKFPAGSLADAWGRRALMLAGLFVFAFAPPLHLLVPAAAWLVAVRLLHGAATALYGPSAMAAVAALAGERKGEALAWLTNAKHAGKLGGAFLGGALLAGATSGGAFARVYLTATLLGGAALLVGLTVLRGLDPPHRPSAREALRRGLNLGRNPWVLLAAGTEGFQNLSVGLLEHFLPLYVLLAAGGTAFEAGLLYGVQTAVVLLAKPACGRFSDRRGRRGVLLAGLLLCALALALLPWLTGLLSLIGAALLFGLGDALVSAAAAALVAELTPKERLGAAMGVFGTLKDVGHALGPVLGGVLLAAFGGGNMHGPEPFRATFALVAGALAGYAAAFALATRRR